MAPTLKRRRGPPQEDQLGEGTKSQGPAVGGSSSHLVKLGAIGFGLGGVGWISVYLLSLRLALTPPTSLLPLEFSLWLYMGTIAVSVVGLVGLHAL